MSYRVVYGETMPAWERIFATKKEADTFARMQQSVGDVIFSVKPVKPGDDRPYSVMAAIAARGAK